MTQQESNHNDSVNEPREEDGTTSAGEARDDQDSELEAEQESAAAMDADVPQPPSADSTTEGQPS